MAKSERAQRGGGREVALNPGSFQAPYQVGVTYGNTGQGANWFGPGQPMAPQAPEEVAGRAFDFPNGYNIINTTRAYEPIGFPVLRAFADAYDLLRLIIERSEEHTSELQSLMRISYAVFCLKKKNK